MGGEEVRGTTVFANILNEGTIVDFISLDCHAKGWTLATDSHILEKRVCANGLVVKWNLSTEVS